MAVLVNIRIYLYQPKPSRNPYINQNCLEILKLNSHCPQFTKTAKSFKLSQNLYIDQNCPKNLILTILSRNAYINQTVPKSFKQNCPEILKLNSHCPQFTKTAKSPKLSQNLYIDQDCPKNLILTILSRNACINQTVPKSFKQNCPEILIFIKTVPKPLY